MDLKKISRLVARMSYRERQFVFIGGGGIGVVLIVLLVLSAQSGINRIADRVAQDREVSQKIEALARQLEMVQEKQAGLPGKQETGLIESLPAWLERLIKKNGLKEKVRQIAAGQVVPGDFYKERATLELEDVEVGQVLRLVEQLEKNPAIGLVRVDIRRSAQKKKALFMSAEIGSL